LISYISNKTLHELKVNNNNIGSGNGSKVIAEILKQQESLKKLDISNNNIKDLGIIEHIAKTLGITKIKAVNNENKWNYRYGGSSYC
jgi:hypothetical protein